MFDSSRHHAMRRLFLPEGMPRYQANITNYYYCYFIDVVIIIIIIISIIIIIIIITIIIIIIIIIIVIIIIIIIIITIIVIIIIITSIITIIIIIIHLYPNVLVMWHGIALISKIDDLWLNLDVFIKNECEIDMDDVFYRLISYENIIVFIDTVILSIRR